MPESSLAVPHHRLQIEARLGALCLNVDLELRAPWTVLFGPSGSGKSTLLRAMCGLPLADHRASIRFERIAPDGTCARLDALPAQERNVSLAPQSPALLPHLSVARNVRFVLDVAPRPRIEMDLVDEALTTLRLHALGDRLPRDLSGGEAQRVNLARALAKPHARLLLLDEPFNGIDRALRDALLPELRRVAAERGVPVVSVTHDVEEAIRLDADVVRLEQGRILAQGPAREVLAEEVHRIASVLR